MNSDHSHSITIKVQSWNKPASKLTYGVPVFLPALSTELVFCWSLISSTAHLCSERTSKEYGDLQTSMRVITAPLKLRSEEPKADNREHHWCSLGYIQNSYWWTSWIMCFCPDLNVTRLEHQVEKNTDCWKKPGRCGSRHCRCSPCSGLKHDVKVVDGFELQLPKRVQLLLSLAWHLEIVSWVKNYIMSAIKESSKVD